MSHLRPDIVYAAAEAVQWAVQAVTSALPHTAVVLEAPAGAGKSYAVVSIALQLAATGRRVAISAFTNEQVDELVREAMRRATTLRLLHLHAKTHTSPAAAAQGQVAGSHSAADCPEFDITIATLARLGRRLKHDPAPPSFDVLIVDEAFQASMRDYLRVGEVAVRHLLVGDRGQLAPFSAAEGANFWRGQSHDPLNHSVGVLERNRPQSVVRRRLPVTRRLDGRAVPIARLFYHPEHTFDAAVLDGVRNLTLPEADGTNSWDAPLLHAASTGWCWAEVEAPDDGSVDLVFAQEISGAIARILDSGATYTLETGDGSSTRTQKLMQQDVAVAVPHNAQRVMLRSLLADLGLPDVPVLTANKMQGLTYQVVFAWHPFAGLTELDPFHLEPGRLCVMLTRHRQACIVVARKGDQSLLDGVPPQAEVWLNVSEEPTLSGWLLHEAVAAALTPHRFESTIRGYQAVAEPR